MRHSRNVLLFASFFLYGVFAYVDMHVRNLSAFYLILSLSVVATTTTLCLVDSYVIGKPLGLSTRWFTILCWPVSLIYYLVWSRGWRGAVLGVGFFLMMMGCVIVVSMFD